MEHRLGFVADDFTGATDALDALATHGLRGLLVPSCEETAALAWERYAAVGIATTARTAPTDRLRERLEPAFDGLRVAGASLIHYKVCSTFDSSPAVGSIGRAIEIGCEAVGEQTVLVCIGNPALRRYVAFGNLFAAAGASEETYRLDRHPVMACHPITPMAESDLRAILSEQTRLRVRSLDLTMLDSPDPGRSLTVSAETASPEPVVVVVDTTTDHHLDVIAEQVRLLASAGRPRFIVGSSAVEHVFGRLARAAGADRAGGAGGPARLLAAAESPGSAIGVSGSLSPVTAAQLQEVERAGIDVVALDVAALLTDDRELDCLVESLVSSVRSRRPTVVHTGRSRLGADTLTTGLAIADRLGDVVAEVIRRAPPDRLVIGGGDTSGAVAGRLGAAGFEYAAPLAPGCPICRVIGGPMDGRTIVFKGGQMGTPDLFTRAFR